jgi:hypothetical protein
VGDWERTFGAGVSAESIIAGINADYFAERRAEEREEQERRRSALLAFRGDPALKAELVARLRRLKSRGNLTTERSGLLALLQSQEKSFTAFEERYRIPESLAHVIQAAFEGLRKDGHLCDPTPELDRKAVEWLMTCVEAIKPGTDLRYLAFQAAANAAQSADRLLTVLSGGFLGEQAKTRREACERALAVIFAKARGVILPNELTEMALVPLRKILATTNIEFIDFTSLQDDEYAVAIIEAAASPAADGAARALDFAAQARLRVRGYAMDIETWRVYAEELLQLIEGAPTQRLKMIDLNTIFSSPADNAAAVGKDPG